MYVEHEIMESLKAKGICCVLDIDIDTNRKNVIVCLSISTIKQTSWAYTDFPYIKVKVSKKSSNIIAT